MLKRKLLFYVGFFIANIFLFGQSNNWCGTDYKMRNYFDKHKISPEQHQRYIDSISSFNVSANQDVKVIPLVFHVIHEGHAIGVDENITSSQIEDAVRILNEDFSATNEDLDDVNSQFYNLVGNANIIFKLANLDPDGNCTNGITRQVSELTNQADDCIKSLVSWDDTKYVNIWVVKSIDSSIGSTGIVAGYANLPGQFWEEEAEGIVVNNQYVGSIGTSSGAAFNRHVLTHEMGHFFNLNHPWGSYGTVGEPDNCSTDDGVSDTPNTIGSYSTCNISQETCGSLDNIQNFMDYASCSCMFTHGQINRMQNCLNSSISNRNNLWSNNNLWSTGTHEDYSLEDCVSEADFFISSPNRICSGTPITFINSSKNIGNSSSFSWTFFGPDTQTSSEENPTIIFSETGDYNITLTINNDSGESSVTKTYTVYQAQTNLNEDFQNTQFPLNPIPSLCWTVVSPENETSWLRTPISSSSTNGSVRIRSRTFECSKKHFLYTPNLNLENFGLGTGDPLKLWFDLAYAKRNNQTEDILVVSYSKDCGETWQVRATWDTDDLITNDGSTVGWNFIPNATEWQEKSVNIQSAAEQNNVIIRFEFNGQFGTYLYIDNVRLTGDWIGLNDTQKIENRHFIKHVDVLGRDNNSSNIYLSIYNDGTVKKHYEFD